MKTFLKIVRRVAWVLAILLTVAALIASVAEWASVISFRRLSNGSSDAYKTDAVTNDDADTEADTGEPKGGGKIIAVIFTSLSVMLWMVIASGASFIGALLNLVNVRAEDRGVRLQSRVMLGVCGVVLLSQIAIVVLI